MEGTNAVFYQKPNILLLLLLLGRKNTEVKNILSGPMKS